MQILALGGWPAEPFWDYLVGCTGKERPKFLFLGTASGDDPSSTLAMFETMRDKAEVTHARFFPWPPADVTKSVLGQDVIFVGGGSTANMLAIWRVHGFEKVLLEAWRRGILLCGSSAGAICWFEACVTDSFGPQLEGMRDGLGFLPGSACPHYDGEEGRRPRYMELVRDGFPAGVAIDDAATARFEETKLVEVVTTSDGATSYRVTPEGEEPLDARLLT
jgi:dipeptidase E